MSDVQIVSALRAAYTGYADNDYTAMLELLSDDFHFEMSDSLPYGGVFRGREGFLRWRESVKSRWQYFTYDAHAILVDGTTFVVPVRTDALSVDGIRMRNEHLFLFEAGEERLTFCRLYADTARGRDVLEGREPRRLA